MSHAEKGGKIGGSDGLQGFIRGFEAKVTRNDMGNGNEPTVVVGRSPNSETLPVAITIDECWTDQQ